MSVDEATVFVVDDDEAVRDSLETLVRSAGWNAECYESASAFLENCLPSRAGCLVLDVRMPGMDGLVLQEELQRRGVDMPIVFLTGHGDVRMAVRAIRDGAVDFIEKPFREQELLDSVKRAITLDEERRAGRPQRKAILERLETLTPREREILDLVIEGKTSRAIAADLGLSPKTVDNHRLNMMEKLQVDNVVTLVRTVLSVISESERSAS